MIVTALPLRKDLAGIGEAGCGIGNAIPASLPELVDTFPNLEGVAATHADHHWSADGARAKIR